MKHIPTILIVLTILSMAACKKDSTSPSNEPTEYGSWAYLGKTYAGTFATWTAGSNVFQGVADKPNSSGLQFYFKTTEPSSGTYTIVPFAGGPLSDNQVSVAVVDGSLPAITYFTGTTSSGTATVTRTGSKTKVQISAIKILGFDSGTSKLDSFTVSGTVHD